MTQSLSQIIGFSKDIKTNIFIVLAHGFLYKFSFSVIIPNSILLIGLIGSFGLKNRILRFYWAVLMMMVPLGTLFNYLYETFLFKKSNKKNFNYFLSWINNLKCFIYDSQRSELHRIIICWKIVLCLINLRTPNKI